MYFFFGNTEIPARLSVLTHSLSVRTLAVNHHVAFAAFLLLLLHFPG